MDQPHPHFKVVASARNYALGALQLRRLLSKLRLRRLEKGMARGPGDPKCGETWRRDLGPEKWDIINGIWDINIY